MSEDPEKRLSTLQTGSPVPLELEVCLVEGVDAYDEAYFHARFARQRRLGEWFVLNDELLDFLIELKEKVEMKNR